MIPRRHKPNSALMFVGAVTMVTLFVLSFFMQPAYPADAKKPWKPSPREVGYGQVKFKNHGPEWWYNRAVARTRQLRAAKAKNRKLIAAMRRQQRIILAQPTTRTAIEVAAIVYNQPLADLMRVAGCETGWTYDPKARNTQPIYNGEHATGLFQFIPSTWASTPFARFDIYNGWINALAAAWMWSVGRRGEWACQ